MCANTGFEFCTQITFFDAMYEVAGNTDRGRSYRVIQDDDDMDTGNHSLSASSLQFSPTRRNRLWMNSCSTTKQRHIRLRNCEPRVPTSSNASAPTTCDHNWARVFKIPGFSSSRSSFSQRGESLISWIALSRERRSHKT